MESLQASKLLDQSREASRYSEMLLQRIQSLFRTRKINMYDYEKLINILSCNILATEDIRKQLEKHITENHEQTLHFDVRV